MPPSAPPPVTSRRLPKAVCVLLAFFGAAWTVLTVLSLLIDAIAWTPVAAVNLAVNLASGMLVCAVAWVGTRPRPTSRLTARMLAAAVSVAAIPMLLAVTEGLLARQANVGSSAQADLLAATLVAVTFIAVCRSQPNPPTDSHP